MWQNIKAAPADSILGLTEAFKNDPSADKVNLGVGVYKDEAGRTPVLQCVKAAEKILLEQEGTKSYLPISGDLVYAAEVQKLLFGQKSEVISNGRAVTAHAPGGTGAWHRCRPRTDGSSESRWRSRKPSGHRCDGLT